jgi:hypothetical protein
VTDHDNLAKRRAAASGKSTSCVTSGCRFSSARSDKNDRRFPLYSTSAMWFVLHRITTIGEIEFAPDATHDPIRESADGEITTPSGNLPVQGPLQSTSGRHHHHRPRHAKFDAAANAMEYAVTMEHRNLVYTTSSVRYSLRLLDHSQRIGLPNGTSYVGTGGSEALMLGNMKPMIINLAIAFRDAKNS